MKEYPLVNDYGSRFGTEYVFDSEEAMYQFRFENWPDGDEFSGDVWSQNVFTVGDKPRRANIDNIEE